MPNDLCESCVECFKKHINPGLKKSTCSDYIESLEKIQIKQTVQVQSKVKGVLYGCRSCYP